MTTIEKVNYLINKASLTDLSKKMGISTVTIRNKQREKTKYTFGEVALIDIFYMNQKNAEDLIARANELTK
jgi:hypothetical protein